MQDYDLELCALIPPAVGVLTLGVLSLVTGHAHFAWRLAAGGLAATGVYALLAAVFDSPPLFTHATTALATTVVAAAVVRGAAATTLPRRLATPFGYGAVLAVAGTAALAGLYVRHEEKLNAAFDRDQEAFGLLCVLPEREEVEGVHAVTDRGYPVPLWRARSPRAVTDAAGREKDVLAMLAWGDGTIKRQDSDDNSNCHGWVFTGGRYIVSGSAVEHILHDNGYAAVPTASPGDLAVYRGPQGDVLHTAVVRYVAPGRPPMVEGKWGRMGVYLHAAGDSGYGKAYTFYRSSRDGDLLRGIDGSTGTRFTGAE